MTTTDSNEASIMDHHTIDRRTVLRTVAAGATGTVFLGPAAANQEGIGKYRDVSRARDEGYEFTPCISEMGIHYINFDLIDETVKTSKPEALVYANDDGDLRYLGVEYLATSEFSLFGHHAHFIPELGIYGLHAWFFEQNDNGKHAELHSDVDEDCNYVPELITSFHFLPGLGAAGRTRSISDERRATRSTSAPKYANGCGYTIRVDGRVARSNP